MAVDQGQHENPRRKLKKAVQQGRRHVESRGVPSVGYVEEFDAENDAGGLFHRPDNSRHSFFVRLRPFPGTD